MSRTARAAPGGLVYHAYNRGNGRLRVFTRPAEYDAFVELLAEGRQRANVALLGYCLMPTHWHLLILPTSDADLAGFVGWVSNAHVRRWHQSHRSVGGGHIYHGRYRSFPVESAEPFLTALRYVEANALRAGFVSRAEMWRWSSLARRINGDPEKLLGPAPAPLPPDWPRLVNRGLKESELLSLRTCVRRGRPFGSALWVANTVRQLGLERTIRNPWRPRRD